MKTEAEIIGALTHERDQLRAKLDYYVPVASMRRLGMRTLKTQRDKLQAQNDKLRAKLAEYGDLAEKFTDCIADQFCHDDLPDDTKATINIGGRVIDYSLTLGDFRALAAIRSRMGGENE